METNLFDFHFRGAAVYVARQRQIYAEAERNANLFAIAEAQQYMWPKGQITQKHGRNARAGRSLKRVSDRPRPDSRPYIHEQAFPACERMLMAAGGQSPRMTGNLLQLKVCCNAGGLYPIL